MKHHHSTPSIGSGHAVSPEAAGGTSNRRLNWSLIAGLASLALLHPVAGLLGLHEPSGAGSRGPAAVPLVLTALTAVVWIGVVGSSRIARPVLTLALAGVLYGAVELLLGLLLGAGRNAFQMPLAVAAVLLTSLFWGTVAGLLALLVQRLRGFHPARDA